MKHCPTCGQQAEQDGQMQCCCEVSKMKVKIMDDTNRCIENAEEIIMAHEMGMFNGKNSEVAWAKIILANRDAGLIVYDDTRRAEKQNNGVRVDE